MFKIITTKLSIGRLNLRKYLSVFILALTVIGTLPLLFSIGNSVIPKEPLTAKAAGSALDTAFTTNNGTGFRSANFTGIVYDSALQSDGKIVIGGTFVAFNEVTANNLARLNSNGSLDTTFATNIGSGASGTVSTIAIQTDGKILVGGSFSLFNGNTNAHGIVRLNSDGTIDTAFSVGTGSGFGGNIQRIAVQSDGRIVVSGFFTTFNGVSSNGIARLNSDGTPDTTFRTNIGSGFNTGSSIRTLAIQTDGKIVVGGQFSTFNGVSSNCIVRLNTDGTVDTTFRTNIGTGFGSASPVVFALAIQTDGKIVVGGKFSTFNGVSSNRIARLNSDGTPDTAFRTNIGTGFSGGSLIALAIQSDGKIVVGGGSPDLTLFNSTISIRNIARLNSDGTFDQTFKANIGTGLIFWIYTLNIQPDGNIFAGGYFQTSSRGVAINSIARIINTPLTAKFTANIGTGFNGIVNATAQQSDGKIVVGGAFTAFNGTTVNRIARLNTDGSIDTTFTTNIGVGCNNTVNAIAIQPDGSIVVVGAFTSFAGVISNRVARLTTTGTADTTFRTNIGTGFSTNSVLAIALQTDGSIVLGGSFVSFNGTASNRIARLASTGLVDTTFRTNIGAGFSGSVNSLSMQTNQYIVVGGLFATFNAVASNNIARLTTTGTADTTFRTNIGTGFNAVVNTVLVQADQAIVVGGNFTTQNGVAINRLARLTTTGTADTTFRTNLGTGFDAAVNTLAQQADGKIVVGGSFTTQNGVSSNSISRLALSGVVDTFFRNNINNGFITPNSVLAVTVQSDGKLIIGGGFTGFIGAVPYSTSANKITRLDSNGFMDVDSNTTYDITFSFNGGAGLQTTADGTVFATALQPDGKVIVGGDFVKFNGTIVNRIARLNADGTLDTTFATNVGTGFDYTVLSIILQPDGKIVVGGQFSFFNGTVTNSIARLNSDGTLDTAFATNVGLGFSSLSSLPSVQVSSIYVQLDGKIVVGGQFSFFNGTVTNSIARLNSDGTLDTTFSSNTGTGFGNSVMALAIQTDGKIVAGGSFATFNGTAVGNIVRLNPTGTLDTTFTTNSGTGFSSDVHSVAMQSDGKILVGGLFTTFNGTSTGYIARLNSTGTLDTAFNTNIGTGFDTVVNALALQPDGKIVVGGAFTTFNGISANKITRLTSTGTLDTAFNSNMGSGFNSVDTATNPPSVFALAIQSDGKIVAGGTYDLFDTLNIGISIARLLASSPVTLNLTAILGGDYNKGIVGMDVTLKNLNLVPATQPYSVSPFSYSGSETISGAITSNVVDWVLVEIRDSSRTTVVDKKAGLMLANGTIVDAPTQSGGLVFNTLYLGTNYNIIVRHRNHLAISTAAAVTATSTMNIDFTANTNVLGSNQILVDTSKYGMKPGNATGDTAIDSSDRTLVRNGIESYNTYVSKDLNLDGVVNARDRQIMRNASDSSDGI